MLINYTQNKMTAKKRVSTKQHEEIVNQMKIKKKSANIKINIMAC